MAIEMVRSKRVRVLLAETLAIGLGVFLSLWADEWRTNRSLAADGREALEVYREHADLIDFVLLDLTMPIMDGEETLCEMRRLYPDVLVILCSGYNEQVAVQRFADKGLAGFLQKPYTMTTLKEKILAILS